MAGWFALILIILHMLWHMEEAQATPYDTHEWEMPVVEDAIVLHIWDQDRIHDFVVAEIGPPAEGLSYVGAAKVIYDENNVPTCHIWVPPLHNTDFAIEVWRHEIRHCTGWDHPEWDEMTEEEEDKLRVVIKPGLPKLTLPPDDSVPGMY